MSTIGELEVMITADTSQYMNAIRQVQNQTNSIMGRVNNVISSVKKTVATALGTAAIVSFGKSCIELGSDLAEVQNVVDVTFTTMSDSVDKFTKSAATSFGLSETMAKKYVGTFGAMSKSFGFTEQEAYKMSTTLAGLTGDVASFYNMSQDEAYTKLKSVFTGETESLKDLGIVMTQTALDQYALANGFGKTTSKMTEQEKTALRYQFVLEQLSLAQGDFSRTSDSWANQVRILELRFESFKATIGQGLINVFLPVIKVLNAVILKLQVFAEYFAAITGALFGKAQDNATNTSKATTSLNNSMSNLGTSSNNTSNALKKATSATQKAGTAAKKAKKEIGGLIGGLDEINNLSVSTTAGTSSNSTTPSTSTHSVGGLGDLDTIDMSEAIDTSGLDKKVEKIKAIFDKIKKIISDNKETIIAVMSGLMAGLGVILIANWGKIAGLFATHFPKLSKLFSVLGKAITKPFKLLKKGITVLLGLNPVVTVVAIAIGILVGALVYLWRTNKDFREKVIKTWKAIKDALEPWIEGFSILFETLADIVGTVLVEAFKLIGKAILKVVEVLTGSKMNKLQDLAPIIKKLGENFKRSAKKFQDAWKKVKKIKQLIEKIGLKKIIVIGLDKLKKKIKDKLKEMKDEFIKKVKDHFKEMGENIQKKWEELTKPVSDFVITIGSKVEDFKDKASDKWDGVKDWFKDKVLGISTEVEGFEGKVEDEIDKTNETTGKKKISIKNIVEDIQGKVSNAWEIANEWVGKQKINIGNKVEDIKGKVSIAWETAQQWINKQKLNISTKVGSFYDKVKEAKDYATGKIKTWSFTIGAKVGSFYSKLQTAYNDAKKKIKSWAFSVALKITSSTSGIKSMVNSVIKSINNNVLAKIKIKAPSWLGGWSWTVPKIPMLAKGGIVDSATLSVIGEAGKEAVIPLENNTRGLDLLASKLQSRMSIGNVSAFSGFNSSNSQPQEVYNGDVIIKLDGNTVFRQSVVSILRQMKRQGITI